MDLLSKIKRLALSRRIVFTAKAENEMDIDGLSKSDVIESIVSADRIDKNHPLDERTAVLAKRIALRAEGTDIQQRAGVY